MGLTLPIIARPARARRAPTVRAYLVLIVATAVLPLLLLAALLARGYFIAETERFERGVRDAVFDTTLVLERDIAGIIATLQALATSRTLRDGDLAAFHHQATAVREAIGANIVLRDPSGRQVVSTLLPWGTPLPATSALLRWDPEIRATLRPLVTGHYRGVVGGDHSFAVVVPVLRDGEIAWMLHVSLPATHLRDILVRASIPGDGNIGLTDRDHVVLARNRRHEEAVGTGSTATPILRGMTGDEASGRQRDREGREVFVAFRRIPSTGWTLGAGVPVETVLAPLRRTLLNAALAAAALSIVALAGAWLFGNRLARAIRHLAEYGAALEGGRAVVPPREAIREVGEVGAALATAAARHNLMLHELNHRVRNTLATVDAMARLSARHATDVKDHAARLTERIRALGKTHVLLTGTHWTEARLDEVLRGELAVHDVPGARRVVLDGPPILLPARQAVSVGMLAHELATNAAKYGALSRPEGRVEIRWTTRAGRVELTWEEHDGPVVASPTRAGFGTALIERGIARDLVAEVAADYRPEGLRFRLSFPLGDTPPAFLAPDRSATPAPQRARDAATP